MPPIRMKATRADPPRKEGRLYNVDWPESWHLVRDGYAEWEYVPELKVAALLKAEPKKAS